MIPDEFRLGLFQCDLTWENTSANLSRLEALGPEFAGTCDLLLVPETFSTGFTSKPAGLALNEQNGALERIIQVAKNLKTHVAGSFIWKHENTYRNRFILVNELGIQGHYDKHHLFGLGQETQLFQAGIERTTWMVGGFKIAPFVCYDLRFPEWCGNSEKCDLMIFCANWPEARVSHWKTLLNARAIENQCYVAGVNRIGRDGNQLTYSGDSLVIDANGSTLLDSGATESLKIVKLSKSNLAAYRNKLPFLNDRFQ